MYKISYTPFIAESEPQDSNWNIPESSFLNPIRISDDVVSEVIKPTVKTVINSESQIKSATPESKLSWARKVTSKSNTETNKTDTTSVSTVINWNDLKQRQMMAESGGNAQAVSRAGAKGLYQIMDGTHQDYIKATGDVGDIFDAKYNEKVRDWYMNWLLNNKIIKDSSSSDIEKARNALIAYNWGINNLQQYLAGNKELPEETKKYIEKILPTT